MKTKSKVRAGGGNYNHNESNLRIKSKVRAGGGTYNHNETQRR